MNPMIPPPVPACHGFADCAVMGAASASINSESWRRSEMTKFIMLAVLVRVKVVVGVISLVVRDWERCSADGSCLVLYEEAGAELFYVPHGPTSRTTEPVTRHSQSGLACINPHKRRYIEPLWHSSPIKSAFIYRNYSAESVLLRRVCKLRRLCRHVHGDCQREYDTSTDLTSPHLNILELWYKLPIVG
jgi:hypothetical protein